MGKQELVRLPGGGVCVKESEKALLVRLKEVELWIPKSLVHEDSECYKVGAEGTVIVPRWWAEKADLEGEDYDG